MEETGSVGESLSVWSDWRPLALFYKCKETLHICEHYIKTEKVLMLTRTFDMNDLFHLGYRKRHHTSPHSYGTIFLRQSANTDQYALTQRQDRGSKWIL